MIFNLNKQEVEKKLSENIIFKDYKKYKSETKNVYNISFYYGSGKIFCNCPDGRGQCKNIGVFCKHICFIITKVFSKIFNINDSNIFNILIFN